MRQGSQKLFALRPLAVAIAGLVPVFNLALLPRHMSAADTTTQPAADTPDAETAEIKASFVDLANPDETVRSAAILKLKGLRADDLPALKKVVEQCRPLLPAQSAVLRQIVTQVYLSGEHYEFAGNSGFLGIKMEHGPSTFSGLSEDGNFPAAGIVVYERIPGFPAARMLQDGDVILSITDRPEVPIRETRDLMMIVMDLGAGSTVHFLIQRRGQILPIAITLASKPLEANDINRMDNMIDMRRRRANEYWLAEFASLVKEEVS